MHRSSHRRSAGGAHFDAPAEERFQRRDAAIAAMQQSDKARSRAKWDQTALRLGDRAQHDAAAAAAGEDAQAQAVINKKMGIVRTRLRFCDALESQG